MNRLILGAGMTRRDGWTTLDANPKLEPDIVAIFPPLPPEVHAKSWNEIEWIHGITSLYPWDAEAMLDEIHGVLESHGKLVLEQPDFVHARAKLEWVFGDPMSGNPLHMNKWGYTPISLSQMLRKAGFSRVSVLSAQHHLPERDFRIEAYR